MERWIAERNEKPTKCKEAAAREPRVEAWKVRKDMWTGGGDIWSMSIGRRWACWRQALLNSAGSLGSSSSGESCAARSRPAGETSGRRGRREWSCLWYRKRSTVCVARVAYFSPIFQDLSFFHSRGYFCRHQHRRRPRPSRDGFVSQDHASVLYGPATHRTNFSFALHSASTVLLLRRPLVLSIGFHSVPRHHWPQLWLRLKA